MAKVAVLMVEGYEESETMQIVDLLRRAGHEVATYRFQDDPYVRSMQGMYVRADAVFGPEVRAADAVVVPGGRTAAAQGVHAVRKGGRALGRTSWREGRGAGTRERTGAGAAGARAGAGTRLSRAVPLARGAAASPPVRYTGSGRGREAA